MRGHRIPEELARIRRQAWARAVRASGLRQDEIAEVVGASESTVRSYGWRDGNVPTEAALDALKRHNLGKALETLKERYGEDAVRIAAPRL